MEQKQRSSSRQVPMAMVIARILIVSGVGLSASIGILFLIAGGDLWKIGLPLLGLTALFIGLMFIIERAAE